MSENARRWRLLAAGTGVCAAVTAGVLGVVGATASAEPAPAPVLPAPAAPAGPVVITQTVTVTPNAPAVIPAANPAGVPALAAAPAPAAVPAPAVVPVPAVPTITPAATGTLAEYFASKGVRLEPQSSTGFRALNIVLPMPRGWEHIPDPNVPDAFAVIADRVGGNGLYSSNAQLVVYKLVGQFDPKEAISHGYVDSQQLPAWRTTDASLADFGGMPSSVIEGTYRENQMTLNTSRRHVLATVGPDTYLVSLSVTTSVDQVVAAAGATDAVVNGFKVSVPGAAPAAPPAPLAAPAPAPAAPGVPAPAAPALPVAAVAPQPLGLQG
jgi:hypothetical protein